MSRLREAAQQALDYMNSVGQMDMCPEEWAIVGRLEAALAESEPPKTAWAHLPNAKHIDRILAHVKAHPHKWDATLDAAWDATRDAARDAARGAAWAAAWGATRDATLDAAWGATLDAAWGATRDAVSALIAWDEAGLLLSQPIDAVKARADEGDHAAILIYPAMLAMKEEK